MEIRRQVIAACAAPLGGLVGLAPRAAPRLPVAMPAAMLPHRSAFALLGRLLAFLALPVMVSSAHASDEARSAESSRDLPPFLFQPLYASNEGSVYGIYEARHADLVLVDGGFDSGFQTGMVCRVIDGEGDVGEIMLVEVRDNCAGALILQLDAGKVIEPGHSVRIKTVTF